MGRVAELGSLGRFTRMNTKQKLVVVVCCISLMASAAFPARRFVGSVVAMHGSTLAPRAFVYAPDLYRTKDQAMFELDLARMFSEWVLIVAVGTLGIVILKRHENAA